MVSAFTMAKTEISTEQGTAGGAAADIAAADNAAEVAPVVNAEEAEPEAAHSDEVEGALGDGPEDEEAQEEEGAGEAEEAETEEAAGEVQQDDQERQPEIEQQVAAGTVQTGGQEITQTNQAQPPLPPPNSDPSATPAMLETSIDSKDLPSKEQMFRKFNDEIQRLAKLPNKAFFNAIAKRGVLLLGANGDPERFLPVKALTDLHSGMLEEIKSQDSFETLQKQFKTALGLISQGSAGVQKSCLDVKGFLGKRERDRKREEAAKKVTEEAEDVKRTTSAAAAKASELKKKLQQEEDQAGQVVSPICVALAEAGQLGIPEIELMTMAAIADINAMDDDHSDAAKLFDRPWMVLPEDKMLLWSGHEKVLRSMGGWAKQCKAMDDFKDHGRCQFPMKLGADQSQELINHMKIKEVMADISAVAGGHVFLTTVWIFAVGPSVRQAAVLPNMAGMFKVMYDGEIDYFLIEIASMKRIMLIGGAEEGHQLAALVSTLENATGTHLLALMEAGLVVKYAKHVQNSALYVPMGWIAIEAASATKRLHYGIRMSVMTNTAKACRDYEMCIDYYGKAGRDIKRMKAILQCMSPQDLD